MVKEEEWYLPSARTGLDSTPPLHYPGRFRSIPLSPYFEPLSRNRLVDPLLGNYAWERAES
jgi:hypothetical protein